GPVKPPWHAPTAPHEPYATRRRSLKPRGSAASSCGSGCIRESAKFVETTSEGSRSTSPPAWEPWRVPERSLSPGRSKTSSWDRVSTSSTAANTNSRACQGPGSCSPSRGDRGPGKRGDGARGGERQLPLSASTARDTCLIGTRSGAICGNERQQLS